MKFLEAREKLLKLADGKYCTITYSVKDFRGESHIVCEVYLGDYNFHRGETWEEALQSLEYEMFPERKPVPEIEDI